MKDPLKTSCRLAVLSLLVFGASLTFGQSQDPSCNQFGQIRGVFYMRCFDRQWNEWTDTGRIRRAVAQAAALGSGKVVFDWGWTYEVDGPIDLPSFIIIEGINKNTLLNNGGSTIVLKAGRPGPIFRIGPGATDITIRDLGLKAQSRSGTTAILASNTPNDNTSALHIQLSNLRFSNFAKGIHVTDVVNDAFEWQFDDARLVSSTFESCDVGIELNSSNAQWLMSNVYFISVPAATGPTGSYGVKVRKSGSLSLNFVQGGGPHGPGELAGTFIYVAEHGVLSIQNSQSERFHRALEINRSELAQNIAPINLLSNSFSEPVVLKNATVFSQGNQYGLTNVVASGNTRVTSFGDKFCVAPPINCEGGKIQLQDHAKIALGVVDSVTGFETTVGTDLKVENGSSNSTKALISGITSHNNGKPLMELGISSPAGTFKYSFRRDLSNGWLALDASQADPYKGFMFNGPVALPTYTRATIPIGIAPNGSMLYCSDCQPNTTPCAGGGSGALVVMINYIWACK